MEGRALRTFDVAVNGIDLHVTEMGEGPVILFCHGFPDTSRTWRRQMEAVARAGYRAIAPDMRGYGGSSVPEDPTHYTPFYTVGDLVGLLDALGVGAATVVGHDWGANVAWHAALLRPDRFTAVAGLSVFHVPRGERSLLDAMRARGRDSFYMFELIDLAERHAHVDATHMISGGLYWGSGAPPAGTQWSPFDPARGFDRPPPAVPPAYVDPAYLSETIAVFDRTGFQGGMNYYRAVQPFFDASSALKGAKVRQPSLFIVGTSDGINEVRRPSTDEVRFGAPGLVDHIELDGIGHWIQLEAPDAVNAHLLRFLDGTRAAS